MPTEIYLVKVGMNMTEGVVDEWYIPDGSTVEVGEMLYRLETEKVNLDVDAEAAGTVKHSVSEGITMKPGDVVGHIYATNEDIPDGAPQVNESTIEEETSAAAAVLETSETEETTKPIKRADGERIFISPVARRLASEGNIDISLITGSGPGGRIVEADVKNAKSSEQPSGGATRSSPVARKLARELGIDLTSVVGTGPGGRITKEDVELAASKPTPPTPSQPTVIAAQREDQTIPIRGMRKTIATRMHESLQTMAQLTMDMDVIMDDAIKLRGQLIEEWADDNVKPTYTDLVIRASAKALEKHPSMNSIFGETEIKMLGEINVGMAVALEEGLIVPVIRNANLISIKELASESNRLAIAARDGALNPDDLIGGTFTVSALGMFGVDSFTPIINSPQAGILGVNRLREDIAWDGSLPIKQNRMKLSLTWDHRVLDGAPAAQFLRTVRDLLEAPYRLLI